MKPKDRLMSAEVRLEAKDSVTEETPKPEDGFWDWELISSYSRAQAVADGVLINITKLASEAGFRYPVAMTSAAWHDCVRVDSADGVHDETGRLWDVLNMLSFAIKGNRESSVIHFCVAVADAHERVTEVRLKCICGPGDTAEPVLTIMLPEED